MPTLSSLLSLLQVETLLKELPPGDTLKDTDGCPHYTYWYDMLRTLCRDMIIKGVIFSSSGTYLPTLWLDDQGENKLAMRLASFIRCGFEHIGW